MNRSVQDITDELFDELPASMDLERLGQWILEHPDHADTFVRQSLVNGGLRELLGGAGELSRGDADSKSLGAPGSVHRPLAPATGRRIGLVAGAMAIAAGLIVAATVFISDAEPPQPIEPTGPTIGVLLADDGVIWSTPPIRAGEPLVAQSVEIESGILELELISGVSVTVRGPSRLSLRDIESIGLARGSVSVHVPEGAEGFAVTAPGGVRVTDLGTMFDMAVGEKQDVDVRVHEGMVRFTRQSGVESQKYELTSGESLRYFDGQVVLRHAPSDRPLLVLHVADGGGVIVGGRGGRQRLEPTPSSYVEGEGVEPDRLYFGENGPSSLVLGPIKSLEPPVESLTLMTFVRLRDLDRQEFQHVIHWSNASSGLPSGLALMVDREGTIGLSFRGDDGQTHEFKSRRGVVKGDSWLHLAVSIDLHHHRVQMYADGNQVATDDIPAAVTRIAMDETTELAIGRLPGLDLNRIFGDVRCVRVFDLEVGPDEMKLWSEVDREGHRTAEGAAFSGVHR